MRTLFADTGYWIAVLDPDDVLHDKALSVSATLVSVRILTSEVVLTEVLNFFAKRGAMFRAAAVTLVESIAQNTNATVAPQTTDLFQQALTLYRRRPDKRWGLTDCASFVLMAAEGMTDALAYDEHFLQAGFNALLRGD